MVKKYLMLNLIILSFLFSAENDGFVNRNMKLWDLNGINSKTLRFDRDKNIINRWFLDKKSDFIIIENMKERNTLRQLALPYNSYYYMEKNTWGQLLRADKLSTDIKIKKLSYPDINNLFDKKNNLFWINKDVVIAIVDFRENGFLKMKAFYNDVMPYYKKRYKIKKEKFILVGNIVIKKKKNYKKLKKYFNFHISEGNKIWKKNEKKYELVRMKNVITTIKSDILKKAYIDYSLAATSKFGKKNIDNYIKTISEEYPINLTFSLKQNVK